MIYFIRIVLMLSDLIRMRALKSKEYRSIHKEVLGEFNYRHTFFETPELFGYRHEAVLERVTTYLHLLENSVGELGEYCGITGVFNPRFELPKIFKVARELLFPELEFRVSGFILGRLYYQIGVENYGVSDFSRIRESVQNLISNIKEETEFSIRNILGLNILSAVKYAQDNICPQIDPIVDAFLLLEMQLRLEGAPWKDIFSVEDLTSRNLILSE